MVDIEQQKTYDVEALIQSLSVLRGVGHVWKMLRSVNQVCDLLRSIGVDRETVHQFQINQIDSDVVKIFKDGDLAQLGLRAMGHRFKVRRFCESTGTQQSEDRAVPSTSAATEENSDTDTSTDITERRQRLLAMLRCNRAQRRVPSSTGRTNLPAGRPRKSSRAITVGMRVLTDNKLDKEGCRTSQTVKAPLGDKNCISIEFPLTANYDTMLNDIQGVMFKDGRNSDMGGANDFNFELVNGRNENLRDGTSGIFSLKSYIDEKHIPGAIRIYLLCSPKVLAETGNDSDTEMYDPSTPSGEVLFRRQREDSPPEQNSQDSSGSSLPDVAGHLLPPATANVTESSTSMQTAQRNYAELICFSDSEEEFEAAVQASLADVVPVGSNESVRDLISQIMTKINKEQEPDFINVIRGKVLDGATRAIKRVSFKPDRPLNVKFMDGQGQSEGAVDKGGRKREFFTLALQELHEGQMFLWPTGNKVFALNQGAMNKDLYYVAGVIMALSLGHGCGGPKFFSPRIFEWVSMGYTYVRAKLALEDIPTDTEIFSQLKRLQSSERLEDAEIAFQELSTFLECAGCTIPLRSLKDTEKIISTCVQFHLLDRTRSCMERIRRNPEAFKPLFCGKAQKVDLLTMGGLFAPELSPVGHNSRQHELSSLAFWNDYLIDINEGDAQLQLGDVIMFATGLDTVPPCGFNPTPKLEFLPYSAEYPTANTCTCILRLPVVHQDYETFKENFEFAVLNAAGFGQA